MDEKSEFAKIIALHSDAILEHEGGKPVVLLPRFTFRAGGKNHTVDLLLHPLAQQGEYHSRLYFKEKIEGTSANWQQQNALGSPWWVYSWKGVPSSMPWPNMLCEHLRAIA
jgi:hypothetical protein